MNPTLSPDPADSALLARIHQEIAQAGGWLPFDRFMALALYTPGQGYYAHTGRKFGHMPTSGSDFVTAPELSPAFGRALARQVAQALAHSGTHTVWEFGPGSGALARQLLEALGDRVREYVLVDLSGSLRARQRETLAPYADRVRWVDALPERMSGVVVGNEVLDAMPVRLLQRTAGQWHERGVVATPEGLAWQDRPSAERPPIAVDGAHDYLTEIHPQAEAFVRTLARGLLADVQAGGAGGSVFLIDYGFPEQEYYHPQRSGGTVMCHHAHHSDPDPLHAVGEKDITAHVNFTAVALAAQEAGLEVLGYTSQARFLMNCGLLEDLSQADLVERARGQKLILEHEMGELFKVIGLGTGAWEPLGFTQGDRSHRL